MGRGPVTEDNRLSQPYVADLVHYVAEVRQLDRLARDVVCHRWPILIDRHRGVQIRGVLGVAGAVVFVEMVEPLNGGGLGVMRADFDEVVAGHREVESAVEGHVATCELGLVVNTAGEKSGGAGVFLGVLLELESPHLYPSRYHSVYHSTYHAAS